MNPAYEPVLAAGALAGIVGAVLVLLVSFGVRVTEDQQKAILAVVTLLAPIIAAWVARSKVTPMAKLEDAYGTDAAQRLTEGKSVSQ